MVLDIQALIQFDMHWLNRKYALWFIFLLFFISTFYIGFYVTRDQEIQLISAYFSCFCCYLLIVYFLFVKKQQFSFNALLVFAIFLRLALFFNFPNLSDDFFRFSWDGNVCIETTNPYQHKPADYHFNDFEKENYALTNLKSSSITFFSEGMNSENYFSVYPPVAQLLFLICSYFSGLSLFANVLLLRIVFLFFEVLGWFYMIKLLKRFGINKLNSLIYILNPLVIIELTGNLHLEGLAVSFLLMSLYFLNTKHILLSGLFFSFSICVKLLPLMLIPVFVYHLGIKNFARFLLVILIACTVMFLPFSGWELSANFFESILLYFNCFEFNASFYYVFRWIGFYLSGYNQIALIGKLMSIVFVCFLLFLSFSKQPTIKRLDLFKKVSLVFLIYFLFSAVVHPWYIIFVIAFAVFTGYLFPLVWSLVIFLSYFSYRSVNIVDESSIFLLVQYIILLIVVIGDLMFSWANPFFLKDESQELLV